LSSFGLSSNSLETLDFECFSGSLDGSHPLVLLALGGLLLGDVSAMLVSGNISCLEATDGSDFSAFENLDFSKSTFGNL